MYAWSPAVESLTPVGSITRFGSVLLDWSGTWYTESFVNCPQFVVLAVASQVGALGGGAPGVPATQPPTIGTRVKTAAARASLRGEKKRRVLNCNRSGCA
jgi:hypothetical protein